MATHIGVVSTQTIACVSTISLVVLAGSMILSYPIELCLLFKLCYQTEGRLGYGTSQTGNLRSQSGLLVGQVSTHIKSFHDKL